MSRADTVFEHNQRLIAAAKAIITERRGPMPDALPLPDALTPVTGKEWTAKLERMADWYAREDARKHWDKQMRAVFHELKAGTSEALIRERSGTSYRECVA